MKFIIRQKKLKICAFSIKMCTYLQIKLWKKIIENSSVFISFILNGIYGGDMRQIQIERLALKSYRELCAIVGFSTGILYSLLGICVNILGRLGVNVSAYNITILKIITAPFTYAIGGIFIGILTYRPHKVIMKYNKGTVIDYEPKN